MLSQHAPNLTSLWCTLTLTPDAPLLLLTKLTSLQLRLADVYSAGELNRVLTTLAALPSLQRLRFCGLTNVNVNVSLLGASPSLRDLTLQDLLGNRPVLSDSQVTQIRSSLGHLQRMAFGMDSVRIAKLMQPPVTARWQDIGPVFAAAHTGDLLVTLPTLTRLDLEFSDDAPADFLCKLPLLSSLRLNCWPLIPPAPLLASLLPCTGLTELDLECKFNSAQVSALLAALTKLRAFTLRGRLESLQCFASGPATLTLESLFLRQRTLLPSSEAVHLHALQGLQSLEFEDLFESLDDDYLDVFYPPSAILPRLTSCVWIVDDRLKWAASGPSLA